MVDKYKTILVTVIIVVIILVSVLVYFKYTVPAEYNIPSGLIIVDALSRTVSLNKTPERIISLAPSITELVFLLGQEDKLIGVDSFSYNSSYLGISYYCREHNISDVGGYWWSTIDIEKIISLNPDLILADMGAHIKLNQTFYEYELTVIYLHGGSSSSINDIYSDIDIIASVFDVEDKASELKNNISLKVENAEQYAIKNCLNGTRVLIVVGFYNGIWVSGEQTYIDDLLNNIGLDNAAKVTGWSIASIEDIARWDPDAIIIASMGIDYNVINESGLPLLKKPMIILNSTETDILVRPGPRLGDAALLIVYKLFNAIGGCKLV